MAVWEDLLRGIPEPLQPLLTVAVILILGWIIGRGCGMAARRISMSMGVNDMVSRTPLSSMLSKWKLTVDRALDISVRWIVYMIALAFAIESIGGDLISPTVKTFIGRLPFLALAVLGMLLGAIAIEILSKGIMGYLSESKIPYPHLITAFIRVIGYLVVVAFVLLILGITPTIIEYIALALILSVAAGLSVGIGVAISQGMKESIKKQAPELLSRFAETVKLAEAGEEIEELRRDKHELEEKIKELEHEVERLKTLKVGDAEACIKKTVGEAGSVTPHFEGFKIIVRKPAELKWDELIKVACDFDFEAIVETEDDKQIIYLRKKKE